MSAYVRELLIDTVYGNSMLEDVVDFNNSLKTLLRNNDITLTHVLVLKKYLSGYSIDELLLQYPNAKELLIQVMALLEKDTRHSDEYIIQIGLQKFPQYKKIASALRKHIQYYGRQFTSLDDN